MKRQKRDKRKRCCETIQFFQWHTLPCDMSLLTLLLYPWCKNAWWTIYPTGWMSLECYTWNWRKSKQKHQLGYCQGTEWARYLRRSGGSQGQTGQEVVGQVLAGEVLPCPPQSKNWTINSILLPRPLKPWGREISLSVCLSWHNGFAPFLELLCPKRRKREKMTGFGHYGLNS